MAQSRLQAAGVGRTQRAGAATLALAFGLAGLAAGALAQAPPAAPPAKKPPAAAPAAKAAAAAPAAGGDQSAWVKLCEKATVINKDKDGKEEKKDVNICLTHHERLDGNTGMVMVSAAIRQIEGQDKQHFMVMVPLGMLIQAGMRAAVYPKDMWEKAQKNEKIDETKLKPMKLAYTLCHPAGCTAELEATPELLADLKAGGGIIIFAINAGGQPIPFPVPLIGFDASYSGQPVDTKKYGEARRALMQQIAQRQAAQAEEARKQNDDLQKMQGIDALKGAPKAAPAPAAPAKK